MDIPRHDALRMAGQVAFAAAAVFVLMSAWPSDAPSWLVCAILVLCSPLVGDFAVTMSERYSPTMDWRACFRRVAAPSRCDRCGTALSQFDMVPFLSSSARTGFCSCGDYRVPGSYGSWSALTLAASLALLFAAWWTGDAGSSLAPLVVTLFFMPAVVMDVRHGEVDPAVLALGVAGSLIAGAVAQGPVGAAVGFASGLALISACGAVSWFAIAPREDGSRPFPLGRVDLWVCAGACSILGPEGLASFLIWCVPAAVLALSLVAVSLRGSAYGPVGDGALAFPMVPVIVVASCFASLIPVV